MPAVMGRGQSCIISSIGAVGQPLRVPGEGKVELYTDKELLLSQVSGGSGRSARGEVHGKIQV